MKTVIAGLEEGLNAIAEALEGGGGGGEGGIVPTPTAADEGKVLTANDDGTASWEDVEALPSYTSPTDSGKVLQLIEQDQEGNLVPEWSQINTVPVGGNVGQILTRTASASGYGWVNPRGLKAFTTQINSDDWTAGTGTHSALIDDTKVPNPTNILSIFAWYSDGINYYTVPIESIYYDMKAEEFQITISDTYYTPMSQNLSALDVKIIYFD